MNRGAMQGRAVDPATIIDHVVRMAPHAVAERQAASRPSGIDLEARPTALLVCRRKAYREWGSRWLTQVGLETRVATSVREARAVIGRAAPDVLVIDAAERDRDGLMLSKAVPTPPPAHLAVLGVCGNANDVRKALAVGAADVVRRPLDWRLVARRALRLARASRECRELEATRTELERVRGEAQSARDRLEETAGTDAVTGLPNRETFLRLVERTLASPRPTGSITGLLFLGLDGLETVQAAAGDVGTDALLEQIGHRLRDCLRSPELVAGRTGSLVSASIARLSNDHFGLMVSNVSSLERLQPLAESILASLSDAFDLGRRAATSVTASIGGAGHPQDAKDGDQLLRHAELAMLEAKRSGGGMVYLFDDSLHEKANRQLRLAHDLRLAIERREFDLHYQPLVDWRTETVVAAEALLRWNHPEAGQVAPMEFIPAAEESGLMVPIGSWVLHSVCRQLRTWMDQGLPPLRMTVNVSRCQLLRGDLLGDVSRALEESGIEPRLLELELSERGVLGRTRRIQELLQELKQLGVRLSVDDFGTGDSAVAYLRRLPLDVLKIDRSLTLGAETSEDDAAIASAMVAMAQRLRLRVVVEGVETSEQLILAKSWGCNEIQGFFYSRPKQRGEFAALAENGRWTIPASEVPA